jgi:uncharacterized protein (DUF1501 family)
MDPREEYRRQETRRHFLQRATVGIGAAALGTLLDLDSLTPSAAAAADRTLSAPHFPPRAKRMIYLFMAGAPSQIDLLDYKPDLGKLFDKDLPDSIRMGQRITTMTSGQTRLPVAPSIYKFKQYGPAGAWVSDLLSQTASVADQLAIVKTVHTEAINHDPAITYIQTGRQLPGLPSLGAWLAYGLGSANDNLPSFVVMTPTWTGRQEAQALYSRLWGSGFLPAKYQGVSLRAHGDPVLYLNNPPGVTPAARRRMLDGLGQLNQRRYDQLGDPEITARIAQYEMAFRMQTSVPNLTDFSDEPQHVLDAYGPDVSKPGTFAASCLLARRMAERDVRFVQIFHRGWDQHNHLPKDLPNQCRDVDQPCAALIKDLKQRGLLDDTLVVWGGEFGRTVYCQGTLTKTDYGRDHHPRCFSVWLAGGGIQGGIVHGETDEFSYNIVRDPVHIRDLNATILHCLGIDHQRLTYRFQGLDQRLTGVIPAYVVKQILA